jgi:hypothetical protein
MNQNIIPEWILAIWTLLYSWKLGPFFVATSKLAPPTERFQVLWYMWLHCHLHWQTCVKEKSRHSSIIACQSMKKSDCRRNLYKSYNTQNDSFTYYRIKKKVRKLMTKAWCNPHFLIPIPFCGDFRSIWEKRSVPRCMRFLVSDWCEFFSRTVGGSLRRASAWPMAAAIRIWESNENYTLKK